MDRPGRMGWTRIALGVLGMLLAGAGRAEVTLDGSFGAAGPLAGPNYLIPDGVGRQLGGNLFHSFGAFNVGTGESATFTGPASVANILARVTGGAASGIDGALRSEIAGANLYLFNPAGIVFGPNASLDVSGSFHASTADHLRLGADGRFDAATPADSVLVSAPPSAFGFLAATPAPITLDHTLLEVPAGQGLSLTGGDLTLTDTTLRAPGGRIDVAALAGPGDVQPGEAPASLTVSGGGALGTVRMDDGQLNSRGDGGGTVLVRAGRLLMSNTAFIGSSADGPADGSPPGHAGEGIDIHVDELVLDSAAEISSNVFAGVAADAPPIHIRAGRLEAMNNAVINSVAMSGSLGDSAGLLIEADSLDLHHGAFIRSNTGGSGVSGDLRVVVADELKVRDGGLLFTMAFDGTGSAGDLVISARDVTLSNATANLTAIGTYSSTALGNAGDIRIDADTVHLGPGSEITSLSTGPRDAGNIDISARQISLTGVSNRSSGIFANTRQSGNAGNVTLTADELRLSSFASIQSQSSRDGRGGTLRLTADDLRVTDNAYLYTATSGSGNAGSILLAGDTVTLDEGAGAYAYSQGAGAGGNIEIDARRVSVLGYASALYPLGSDFTGLNAATVNGPGGSIRIHASETATFANRAQLTSNSYGAGLAGTIQVSGGQVDILSGAQLLSSAVGSGAGGLVAVAADGLRLSGVHSQRFSTGGPQQLALSAIASQTLGGAPAGRVEIDVGRLEVLDGARISTQTLGAGAGGAIRVQADSVRVSGHNPLMTELQLEQGFDARLAEWSGSAMITADASSTGAPVSGRAGDVEISATHIEVSDRGRIMSGTMGSGDGGGIHLTGDQVILDSGGEVSARSTGSGAAGNILVTATERFDSRGGAVSTESDQAGGGGITFRVGRLFRVADGSVTTSVRGGGGDAGNIDIDPQFVVLDNARISANAYGGAGGNIRIVSDYYLTSGASVVEASSALGVDGEVTVQAVDTQVTEGLEGPRAEYFDASALLRPRCAARGSGQVGSFTVTGRGGLPADPDRPAWSGYARLLAPAGEAGARPEAGTAALADATCRG